MLRTLGLCVLSGLTALMMGACVGAPESGDEGQGVDVAPEGKGTGTLASDADAIGEAKAPTGNLGAATISYHSGPVILGTTNVYVIWYGAWSTNNPGANAIVTSFLSNIGGSSWFGINTTYHNGSNQYVSNSVHYGGSTTDTGSQGTNLTDQKVANVVSSAITGGKLPKDTNALYFVLTSKEIGETSGFCSQYCGWHTHGSLSGSDIKYSFVGDAGRCISGCAGQSNGPNGNPGADGMVSVIAHELAETVTDPDLNAWYDSQGYENADKCAWQFTPTSTAANGTKYNVTFGGKQYLVQQNWKATTNTCGLN